MMSEVTPTSRRKADHIRINLEEDVQSGLNTGLESLRFEHNALPELNLPEVDTESTLWGRRLRYPVLISSMTGGTKEAMAINQVLAEAAQRYRIAMGVGSQRAALEDASLSSTFAVRQSAPDILLLANLGAVQLNHGYDVEHCRRAVDSVGADALVLHLNPLQEALQPEGDTDFAGLLTKIEAVCAALPVPVVVKEVGWGISASVARRLANAGVACIDVAGAGGTSWSQVEMHRARSPRDAWLAAAFADWGIPTAQAIRQVRQALPHIPLIASGGIRSGLDIAKSITLGADLGGMAGPFLKAAAQSPQAVEDLLDRTTAELRIAMFATGSGSLAQLRQARLLPR
jgi:isopentenyl-diphosphate delta-isomerase